MVLPTAKNGPKDRKGSVRKRSQDQAPGLFLRLKDGDKFSIAAGRPVPLYGVKNTVPRNLGGSPTGLCSSPPHKSQGMGGMDRWKGREKPGCGSTGTPATCPLPLTGQKNSPTPG